MSSRRQFLKTTSAMARALIVPALALAIALPALAQQPAKPLHVGVMLSGIASSTDTRVAALAQGFRELGYVGARTVQLEPRWTDDVRKLPEIANELVAKNVDAIVAQGTPAVQAARAASLRVPIIMTTSGDPVGVGLVESLAHPGGNITGHSIIGATLNEKRLDFMKQVFPGLSRVAILWNTSNPSVALQARDVPASGKKLGLTLQILGSKGPDEFDAAFQAAQKNRVGAVLVF